MKGNQFYLDCILCTRTFVNFLRASLVIRQFTKAIDLQMMFFRLRVCDTPGPLHMLPHLFLP